MMDSFVRRLVERLLEPSLPLSRNRHFHTFEDAGGKARAHSRPAAPRARPRRPAGASSGACHLRSARKGRSGDLRVELRFDDLAGRRTAFLTGEEYALLLRVPGMPEALGRPRRAR